MEISRFFWVIIYTYLSVSTRAEIGQFRSGPYSSIRPAKIFITKLLGDLSPRILNFNSKYKFKTFFHTELSRQNCIKSQTCSKPLRYRGDKSQ